jgi:TolB-like protein/DNA-binding winged helix-turn-helix (wHTH) protein/Flp pilus assembly protein TadD
MRQGLVYEFGSFQLDVGRRVLSTDSVPVDLAPKAIETLVVLVQHHGQLVEKQELMQAIWPDSFVEEANLAVYVSTLRKVFEERKTGERFIETVPRRGYRFVAPVQERAEFPAAAPPTPRARSRSLRTVGLLAASAFVIAAVIAGLEIRGRGQIHSIAVLPLQNLSGDPAQEYLADGLTEALIADLAQIRALQVISRTSVMTYKRSPKKLPEIARELNVDAVVEGSVLRAGNRLQVTAQLIAAATDTHLWAKTFEGSMSDLLNLETQAAETIVQAVRVTLTPAERMHLATVHLVDPEAHEAYLQGRYLWNKRTPEAMLDSLALYEKAARIDSRSAVAYAATASAYYTLWATDQSFYPRELLAKAKAAAGKALAIDEGLAEPHAALAGVKAAESYDWPGADAEFKRAFELDRNNASAHQWYGYMLSWRGRFQEGLEETQRAAKLDPLSQSSFNAVTGSLVAMRRFDEALARTRKLLQLEPASYYGRWAMGDVSAATGKYVEAIAAYREGLRITPHSAGMIGRLGYALALAGRADDARAQLQELEATAKSGYASTTLRAFVYIGLGDREHAIALVQRAYEDRSIGALMLRTDFHFDPLRSDPRFQALLQRTGMDR